MSKLSYAYVLRHDSKAPHCSDLPREQRMEEIEDMGWAEGYAEPGYTDPARGILFANWNHFSDKAGELLEQLGYELEWSDEWDTCGNCAKAVRTTADSHGWQPHFIIEEGELTCLECVDWDSYLENCQDSTEHLVPSACDPAQYGYTRRSEAGQYETGFHQGQNDKPADVLEAYHRKGQYYIVFRCSGVGQFDISWEVWQKDQPPAKKHYIAMNGEHGCLPDSCNVYVERDSAIESLGGLLELSEGQVTELEETGSVECTPEQGAAYCEVVECSCQSPWEHDDQSGGEKRFRDNSPEFFEEVEA